MARLSVNINEETEAALRDLQDKRGMTITELIRRAVSVYSYLEKETREDGKTLQLKSGKTVTNLALL